MFTRPATAVIFAVGALAILILPALSLPGQHGRLSTASDRVLDAPGGGSRSGLAGSAPIVQPLPPMRDAYGNELSDAVATYSIDTEGPAFEEHPPGIEVPRLHPPTT